LSTLLLFSISPPLIPSLTLSLLYLHSFSSSLPYPTVIFLPSSIVSPLPVSSISYRSSRFSPPVYSASMFFFSSLKPFEDIRYVPRIFCLLSPLYYRFSHFLLTPLLRILFIVSPFKTFLSFSYSSIPISWAKSQGSRDACRNRVKWSHEQFETGQPVAGEPFALRSPSEVRTRSHRCDGMIGSYENRPILAARRVGSAADLDDHGTQRSRSIEKSSSGPSDFRRPRAARLSPRRVREVSMPVPEAYLKLRAGRAEPSQP